MKIIKIFLSIIGFISSPSKVFAEKPQACVLINHNVDVDSEIHKAVVQALEGKTLTVLTLPQVLQEIKTNVIKIIEPEVKAGVDRYVKLNDALNGLEPLRLFELRVTVKKVMTYMPVKTVQYIRTMLQQYALD